MSSPCKGGASSLSAPGTRPWGLQNRAGEVPSSVWFNNVGNLGISVFIFVTSWPEKLPRFTAFCVNRADSSLTTFQGRRRRLSRPLQDWGPVLVACPILPGPLTCLCLYPLDQQGLILSLSADFSLSTPFVMFDI